MSEYSRYLCWRKFSDEDLDTLRWAFAEAGVPDMLREVAFEQTLRAGVRDGQKGAKDLAADLGVSRNAVYQEIQRLRELAGTVWLSATEAAEYLRCPLSRVRKLTMTGELPVHRDGRRVLYNREELDEYIRKGGATSP